MSVLSPPFSTILYILGHFSTVRRVPSPTPTETVIGSFKQKRLCLQLNYSILFDFVKLFLSLVSKVSGNLIPALYSPSITITISPAQRLRKNSEGKRINPVQIIILSINILPPLTDFSNIQLYQSNRLPSQNQSTLIKPNIDYAS